MADADSVLTTTDRLMAFAIDQTVIILAALIAPAMLFGFVLPDDTSWVVAVAIIAIVGGGLTGLSAFAIRTEKPLTPGSAIALLPHLQS